MNGKNVKKDLFFAAIIGAVVALLFQKFIVPYIKKEGLPVTVIQQKREDIKKEIDFSDIPREFIPQETTVDLTWGSLTFSTEGASLEKLAINRTHHGASKSMSIVEPIASYPQIARSFVVVFDQGTPYAYTLVKRESQPSKELLVYKGLLPHSQDVIQKTFLIDKAHPLIDMAVELIAHNESTEYRPRVIVRTPSLEGAATEEIISSIIIDNQGAFSKKNISKHEPDLVWIKPQLFGADNRYFVHGLLKDNGLIARAYYAMFDQKHYSFFLEAEPQKGSFSWNMSFFMGPKELEIVNAVDGRLEQTIDYAGWLVPIARLLLWILKLLFSYVHNYGLAIILLTILLKLILLPFSIKTSKSDKAQKEVERKLAYLQQKYKHDPETLNRERAEVIKKHGLPGLGGCLPHLMQLPIFFALSRLLNSSIELYQAPMLWIPDLSARDPWYVLPSIVTISMLTSATTVDDKQKLAFVAVALIFGAFATNFAAGLALYLAVNALFGIVQTQVTKYLKST